jgi:hypothetical protein
MYNKIEVYAAFIPIPPNTKKGKGKREMWEVGKKANVIILRS